MTQPNLEPIRAAVVHSYGPPEAISVEAVPRPTPGPGEVLVRVKVAGVGPWDGWIRAGRSVVPHTLPLTLGSDLSGVVEGVGEGVKDFQLGEPVFGVTNPSFEGAYAEAAVARASMLARKPGRLVSAVSPVDTASLNRPDVHAEFLLVEVTRPRLEWVAEQMVRGDLMVRVGEVLRLAEARKAHQMLEGQLPHPSGKIVLRVSA